MRILLLSMLAFGIIGVMIPTTFAELKEHDNIFVQNPDCNMLFFDIVFDKIFCLRGQGVLT